MFVNRSHVRYKFANTNKLVKTEVSENRGKFYLSLTCFLLFLCRSHTPTWVCQQEFAVWRPLYSCRFGTRRRYIRSVWSSQNTYGEIKRTWYAVEACKKRYHSTFTIANWIRPSEHIRAISGQGVDIGGSRYSKYGFWFANLRIWLRNEINRDRIRFFFLPWFRPSVDSLTVPDLEYTLPKTPRYPVTENEWHPIKCKLLWSWILSVSHFGS